MKETYSGMTKEELIALVAQRDSEILRLKREAEDREERAAQMVNKLASLKCFAEGKAQLGEAESRIAALSGLVDALILKYEKKLAQYGQAAKSLYGGKSERRPINVSSHKVRKPRGSAYRSVVGDLKGLKGALETRTADVDFEGLGLDRGKYVEAQSDLALKLEGVPIAIKPYLEESKKYLLKKGEAPGPRQPAIVSARRDDPYHNSVATASLVSTLATLKCVYGVPVYRVAEHCDVMGFRIGATTLDQILQGGMADLAPIAGLVKARAIAASSSVVHCDETTLRVVQDGKSKRYVYQISTSRFDAPATYMGYTGTRSSDAIKGDFPDGRRFVISCDGFSGYERLRDGAEEGKFQLQCCNFHARKRFVEANEALDESLREGSVSGMVIRKYGEIFAEEERFKDAPPEERVRRRAEPSYMAKVNELIALVESIDAERGTLLDDAKQYFVSREKELFAYLGNGYLDMTNNRAERSFRMLCMAKQNFHLCQTKESAKRLTDCYSVILTALDNGVEVFGYMTYLFGELKKGNKDYERLCPWDEGVLREFGVKNKSLK